MIKKGELDLLKQKYNTGDQSEAIHLAIMECLSDENKERLKKLFPYIGKSHRR